MTSAARTDVFGPDGPARSTLVERSPYAALCVAFGLSFHVLATPQVSGVQMRVGLSDVLLVLLLGAFGVTLVRAGWTPLRSVPVRSYVWLAAIFVVLVASYLQTGIHHDSSAVWARIKIVGFLVLSAYFVLGSWIAAIAGRAGALLVTRGFVAGGWAASVLGILEYGAYFYYDYPITWLPRPAALAENPNAYGIMLTSALALDLGTSDEEPLFSQRLRLWGRAILLLAIFLSASRSAYVGLIFAVVGLRIMKRFLLSAVAKPAAMALALFILLFVAPPRVAELAGGILSRFSSTTGSATSAPSRPRKANFAVSREYADHGFRDRLDITHQALLMWRDRPVLGAGLGSFWRIQQTRNVRYPYLNHNTTLWVASEMGLVGLLVIIGGALTTTWLLVRQAGVMPFAAGVAGMLFVMFGASAGTEVMYQRYTWCFCGLALALVAGSERRREPALP